MPRKVAVFGLRVTFFFISAAPQGLWTKFADKTSPQESQQEANWSDLQRVAENLIGL